MFALESVNETQYFQRALLSETTHPVLAFPKQPEGFSDFRYYTIPELKSLADAAASWYVSNGIHSRKEGQKPLVVASCARGDIDWIIAFYAIMRLGHTFAVISPRLPDTSVVALLTKSSADFLISDREIDVSAYPSTTRIPIFSSKNPRNCPQLPYEDLICDPSVVDLDDAAWVAHSSGSTGLPKLYPSSHRKTVWELGLFRTAFLPAKNDWVASAPYNVLGLRMCVFALTKENATTFFDNDRVPFTNPSLVEFLSAAQPQLIWTTPYSLELIASSKEGLDLLQQAEYVKLFGAVLPQHVGDRLTASGIFIGTEYGLSEGGLLLTSNRRPRDDKDWDYLEPITDAIGKLLRFQPIETSGSGEQMYEIVAGDGVPNVLDEVKDAKGDFYTGDIVLKHPTKASRWKIVGRRDDQIKCYQNDRQVIVNALEYEGKIKAGNEDILEEAVLFGQGKDKLGVLIFSENALGHAQHAVVERVWATIRTSINAKLKVPIEKDMIRIVTDPAGVPRTTKLNFIRPQVYGLYQSVIDDAYAATDKEKHFDIPVHANGHAVKFQG